MFFETNKNGIFTHCATCGAILADSYYQFADNSLNGTVFFELDGTDNVFCSEHCACETLGLIQAKFSTDKQQNNMQKTADWV